MLKMRGRGGQGAWVGGLGRVPGITLCVKAAEYVTKLEVVKGALQRVAVAYKLDLLSHSSRDINNAVIPV